MKPVQAALHVPPVSVSEFSSFKPMWPHSDLNLFEESRLVNQPGIGPAGINKAAHDWTAAWFLARLQIAAVYPDDDVDDV